MQPGQDRANLRFVADPATSFASRLDLVLKLLSIGRTRLAADIGVDKSLVSRWLSGAVHPSSHNLERITRLVAAQRPGFSMLDWEVEAAQFAARLGLAGPAAVTTAAPVPAPARPEGVAATDTLAEWLPLSSVQSHREMLRDGNRYPGLYVQINHRFANTGKNMAGIVPIWRQGDQLRVRFDGPFWGHDGRILIIGHQLFMIAEDSKLAEGLWFEILNGVAEGKALSMDGVFASVQHDRAHTPGATMCMLLRVADLEPDQIPDNDRLVALQNRIWDLCEQDQVAAIAGPAIMAHVDNRLKVPRDDGAVDIHLRAPASRGMTTNSVHPDPMIMAAIARWQAALGL
ncbi:MAG: hypothetical protein CFE37_07840 [Alphaproteobacteria bacterium PA4]|nr:MAG: hypothetical protein CFE37_07840 [Alphaproteobacteria bacterium PA4]